MIISFSAKNFYSIGDEVSINLSNSTKRLCSPEMYFSSSDNSLNINKVSFFGGANGSGKTNLLRILSFLRFMIVDSSLPSNINAPKICFDKFATRINDDTDLSVSFATDDKLEQYFTYTLTLSDKIIVKEKLDVCKKNNVRRTRHTVFSRAWNKDTNSYTSKVDYAFMPTLKNIHDFDDIVNASPRVSFISLFHYMDSTNGILRNIYSYWKRNYTNIIMIGNLDAANSLSGLSSVILGDIALNKRDIAVKDSLVKILKRFDIGFEDIACLVTSAGNIQQIEYGIQHRFDNSSFSLSMANESTGTQRMIILLDGVLQALNSPCGVAILDEMDAYLHPFIFEDIVKMFTSPAINTNNSQLIFGSQSYAILNHLDKQQIILSEKNSHGETEAWRLDDMDENIRNNDNYYAKYLMGIYGGVPNVI